MKWRSVKDLASEDRLVREIYILGEEAVRRFAFNSRICISALALISFMLNYFLIKLYFNIHKSL